MEINLQLLKEKTNTINKLISDYEELNLNYYSKIKEIERFWNNENAKRLLSLLEEEKKQVKKETNNLKEISTIYDYIYNKYNNIGNKVIVNLKEEETILLKINNCIEKIKNIIILYKNINTSEYEKEKILLINNEAQKLRIQLKELENIKKEILDIIKTTREIETDIKEKISKINIEIIKESDISNMIE